MRHLITISLAAALLASAAPAFAAEAAPAAAVSAPRSYSSDHTGVFGGRKIAYRATLAETILHDPKGQPAASLYSFSYVAKGKDTNRPVVFVFNGGPGSSSIWMHMGMLGPRRVAFPDPVHPPTTPPFKLEDNPFSLLDVADLVFIDPVGTGYSRLLPGGKGEDFYGVSQDARATTEFIRDWLSANGRWNSPKYLVGESYGTVRASVLANTLMGGPFSPTGALGGVTLNGVIILGPSFGGRSAGDEAYLNNLPTMAATAWVHGRTPREGRTPESVAAEARRFAAETYLPALYAAEDLPAADRQRVAEGLSKLTGLPAQNWLDSNLRISLEEFGKLLLKDQGLQLGAYDSRYTLPLAASGGDPVADDPAMGQYTPGFIAVLNDYVRNELKAPAPTTYQPIAFGEVNGRWNWGQPRNYAEDLAAAMRRNPSLKVFVGAGYYDLTTTLGSAEYVTRRSGLAHDRLTLRAYPSGHMPYMGDDSPRLLGADIRAFIASR
ncbi:S10 family peptidase [Phenylobacterium koreense]|uniref:Carboxypeptidase C (Cathepsin A) n=2 Tax=Phenylobacterium TaxID=20 RepID=A0ABV2EDY5_9CAUL